MLASSHQIFGLSCGLATLAVQQRLDPSPLSPTEIIIFFTFILIGSLLPDLDSTRSRLGRRFPLISIPIRILFGHRGMTHSLLFVLLIGFISGSVMSSFSVSFYYLWGLPIGVLSHVLGDALTRGGVPLFYPLTSKRFSVPFAMRTGGFRERIVAGSLVVANIWIVWTWVI